MLLRRVEGKALLKVRSGGNKLSLPAQSLPQCRVGLQEESRILYPLGQAEKLFTQLTRRLVLRSHEEENPKSKHHGKKLRGFAYLLTQLTCMSV